MKRVLYITSSIPNKSAGNSLRAYQTIKAISTFANITLFVAHEGEGKISLELEKKAEKIYKEKINIKDKIKGFIVHVVKGEPMQIGKSHSFSKVSKLQTIARQMDPDIIYAHTVRCAHYGISASKVLEGKCQTILDYQDCYSERFSKISKKSNKTVKSVIYGIESKLLDRYEKKIQSKFDDCISITERDKNLLDIEGVQVVPNYVHDPENVAFDMNSKNRIIYVGNMGTYYNISAVKFFCEKVCPILDKRGIKYEFQVIGKKPTQEIKQYENKKITIKGYVNDLSKEYEKAYISVCPVRFATGIQNKIIESMYYGVPVVSSWPAYEGVGAKRDESIMVAETPQEYANSIETLINNRKIYRSVSKKAKKVAKKKYSFGMVCERIKEIIE